MSALRLIRIIVHSVQMVKLVDVTIFSWWQRKVRKFDSCFGHKKDQLMLIFFRFNIN